MEITHETIENFIKTNKNQKIMRIFNTNNIDNKNLEKIEKKLKSHKIINDINNILVNNKITHLKNYAKHIGMTAKEYNNYKKSDIFLLIIKIIIRIKNNNIDNIDSVSHNYISISNSNSLIPLTNIDKNEPGNEYFINSIFLNKDFLEYTSNYNNAIKYKTKKYLDKRDRKFKFIFRNNKLTDDEIKNVEKKWLQSITAEYKVHKPDNIKPNTGKIGEDIIYHYFKHFKQNIYNKDGIGKNIRKPKRIYNTLDINLPDKNDSFCLKKQPINEKINGFDYDLEDDTNYYEIKTYTYYETGSAVEKIAGTLWKYINTYEACKKPLKIICLFEAEKWCKKVGLIKVLDEKLSNNKIKLRKHINNKLHIEFLGFSDMLKNDFKEFKIFDTLVKEYYV
jgi:hypothetical protein|tara:strand:- start:1076 stop:2254 length:1179 start_codon:yes stop_codon:yes gene_type:complete